MEPSPKSHEYDEILPLAIEELSKNCAMLSKQKLEELDTVKGMITKKEYDKMRSDLLKNPF